MSIDNPTLAHFRHFSSLFTPSHLYICRESSTNQLLFMQNKPNFQDAQMNVSNIITMIYQIFIPLAGQKNKPNSNPNKANLRKAKMNVNLTLTKDYRKKDDFVVRINKPNSQNAQNERKRICYRGLWEWNHLPAQKNKPNSNPIKACPERSRMGQFLQRPKSLAKKSGHHPIFAVADFFVVNCLQKKLK